MGENKNSKIHIIKNLFNYRRISFKIIIIVSLIVFISLFTLGFFINNIISLEFSKVSEQRNLEIVSILKEKINSFLDESGKTIANITSEYGLRSNNQAGLVARRLFEEELEQNNYFETLYFIDKNGKITIKSKYDISEKSNYKPEEWIEIEDEQKDEKWSSLHNNVINDGFTITVYRPVFDYSNNYMGVVAGDLSLKKISSLINWQLGENGSVFMIDSKGYIIAHPDDEILNNKENMNNYFNVKKNITEKKGNLIYKKNKSNYLLSYVIIEKIKGALLAQIPESEAFAVRDKIKNRVLYGGLITLILLIIAIYNVNKYSLIRPIKKVQGKMNEVSSGHLNVKLNINRKDEIGDLSKSFNSMVKELKEMIKSVNDVTKKINKYSYNMEEKSNIISEVSSQVANSVQQVASGADEQTQNIEQVNDKIYNLSQQLNELEESDEELENIAGKMDNASEEGQSKIKKVSKQMINIKYSIQKVSEQIDNLEEISLEIDTILDMINDIAKQTNLLALNAAIEAARAGNVGRGFSVVAEEIRELSEESSESAKKINELIKDIKEQTNLAGQRMIKANNQVINGEEVVESTDLAFTEIKDLIKKVRTDIKISLKSINKINNSSQEIAKNVDNIANISENTSINSKEVAAASQEQNVSIDIIKSQTKDLSDLVNDLNEQMNNFKID